MSAGLLRPRSSTASRGPVGDEVELAAFANEVPVARVSIIAKIADAGVSLDFTSERKGGSSTEVGVLAFPIGQWTCLRIHLENSNASLVATGSSSLPTEASSVVSSASIGLAWTGTSAALEMRHAFFDDVAVGSTDPECP